MQIERVHHDTVRSTNDLAKMLAGSGLDHPILITANEQTEGRGREGRPWISPRGGAWMSLVWPVRASDEPDLHAAPLVVGLAVADAIDRVMRGVSPRYDPRELTIKWPNDLLLRGRKVSGILCERQIRPGTPAAIAALVAGVGVNADVDPASFTGPMRVPPTSLTEHAGTRIDPERVIDAFLASAPPLFRALAESGFSPALCHAVESRLAYVGSGPVRFRAGAEVAAGEIVGLDTAGRLRLRTLTGERVFASGEITLEPAPPSAPPSTPPPPLHLT